MLKLKSLNFKNIGRFVDEQIIDFSDLNGLIQVDALNKNTGGSSGAGKSTIFNALEYLLGINDTPVTILQSRITKESVSVEGLFDLDGQEVLIKRTKKGLSIKQGEDVTEGSSKLSEEKLDSILGMPRDLFRVLMHKRQKEGGFFLNFSPKQTHEFLVDAKDLKAHTKKAEAIDSDLKKLESDQISQENKLQSAKSGLESTLNALSAVGEPPQASVYTEDLIKELQIALGHHEKLLQDHETTQAKERLELETGKPRHDFKLYDTTTLKLLEKSLEDSQKVFNFLQNAELMRQSNARELLNKLNVSLITKKSMVEKGDSAKTKAQGIILELKKLKEGICPTCEQAWITDTIKAKEAKLIQDFEAQKILMVAGAKASEDIQSIQNAIEANKEDVKSRPIAGADEHEANIVAIKANINAEKQLQNEHSATVSRQQKALNDEYLVKLNKLTTRQSDELSALRNEIFKLKQQLNTAKQDFESAKMSASRYNTLVLNLKLQKDKYEKEIKLALKSIEEMKEQVEIVKEAKLLVKSFISCSFDDALDSIGNKATQIIRGVPNMSTATIQLEGMRETKDGKVKEEVTAVIHVDGEQSVPIKSLSGGERASIDLAIDFAVVDFIENETGKGSNLYIMDEPFQSLDTENIEQLLEILKNLDTNKTIIIVDHNPIVKEMVSNRITVVRDGEESCIL